MFPIPRQAKHLDKRTLFRHGYTWGYFWYDKRSYVGRSCSGISLRWPIKCYVWSCGIWMLIGYISPASQRLYACRHSVSPTHKFAVTDCHRISLLKILSSEKAAMQNEYNFFWKLFSIYSPWRCSIDPWTLEAELLIEMGYHGNHLGQFGVKKRANSDSVPNTNLVTARIHSLWEGNVFSRVCQSFCRGREVPMWWVTWDSHSHWPWSSTDQFKLVHFGTPPSPGPLQTCSNLFTWHPPPSPSLEHGPWTCSKLFTWGLCPCPRTLPTDLFKLVQLGNSSRPIGGKRVVGFRLKGFLVGFEVSVYICEKTNKRLNYFSRLIL